MKVTRAPSPVHWPPDTCVNLICVGTSDEFPSEMAPGRRWEKKACEDEISGKQIIHGTTLVKATRRRYSERAGQGGVSKRFP